MGREPERNVVREQSIDLLRRLKGWQHHGAQLPYRLIRNAIAWVKAKLVHSANIRLVSHFV